MNGWGWARRRIKVKVHLVAAAFGRIATHGWRRICHEFTVLVGLYKLWYRVLSHDPADMLIDAVVELEQSTQTLGSITSEHDGDLLWLLVRAGHERDASTLSLAIHVADLKDAGDIGNDFVPQRVINVDF